MSEHVDGETVVGYELIAPNSCSAWFAKQELAVSLRLVNKDGKTITGGIREWASRKPKDNPQRRKYPGDVPRFYRSDATPWTAEETKHQALEPTGVYHGASTKHRL